MFHGLTVFSVIFHDVMRMKKYRVLGTQDEIISAC